MNRQFGSHFVTALFSIGLAVIIVLLIFGGRVRQLERTVATTSSALETATTSLEASRADLEAATATIASLEQQTVQLQERVSSAEALIEENLVAAEGRLTLQEEPRQPTAGESTAVETAPAPSPPTGTQPSTEVPSGTPAGTTANTATTTSEEGWRVLQLSFGWEADESDLAPQFRITNDGVVELRGRAVAIRDNPEQGAILQLPSDCRPTSSEFFQSEASAGQNNTVRALLVIDDTGDVVVESLLDDSIMRRGNWVDLRGISFRPGGGCRP